MDRLEENIMRYLSALVVAALGPLSAACALGGEPAAKSARSGAGEIVFSSNRAGPWRLWSVRPDGSGLRQLSPQGGEEHDVDPVFSPDGKTILFTSTRGGTTGVWRMPREGGKPERICDGDQAEWSPDAKQIVLRRQERIIVRELAGGAERQISPKTWPHPSGPAWSPDGKRIAAACRADAGNAVYLLPVGPALPAEAKTEREVAGKAGPTSGGEPILVYDRKPACEPHWSPDGTRLVYETETNICTIDPDGKKNRTVTYFGGVQRYGRFSPDGKSIVYCQGASERGPWELFIISAQGGTPRQLTEGASDMNPDWR